MWLHDASLVQHLLTFPSRVQAEDAISDCKAVAHGKHFDTYLSLWQ